ncbi:MAG: hypothetical protein JWM36_2730 [Hyphomicrobiales bacterium]|nr:hypothetical protein [Hyphomicrobiales bacterium]
MGSWLVVFFVLASTLCATAQTINGNDNGNNNAGLGNGNGRFTPGSRSFLKAQTWFWRNGALEAGPLATTIKRITRGSGS